MLDTLTLALPEHNFVIRHPEHFVHLANSNGGMRAVCNPSTPALKRLCAPRLTLRHDPATDRQSLKVQFSAPKMVFGNNLYEVSDDDRDALLDILTHALEIMGVETEREALLHAQVSGIDYSKNILLERVTPCWLLLRQLEHVDLNAALDLTRTTFRNGGVMVQYHANSFQVALYDKLYEMQRVETQGVKRGAGASYYDPYDRHQWRLLGVDVLRVEVRLQRRKLRALTNQLGIVRPLTLEGLFHASTARMVLRHFWHQIRSGLYAQTVPGDIEQFVSLIGSVFPSRRPGKVMELVTFAQLCRDVGPRAARLMLGLKQHQFYHLRKDLKIIGENVRAPRFLITAKVDEALNDFQPLTEESISLISGA